MTDITSIVKQFREYDSSLRLTTEAELDSDRSYWNKITTLTGVNKFNYHSDYWGDADSYQEEHIDLMNAIKPYIRKKVIIDGREVKLLGIMIDRQYNSISHTRLLIEG